MEKNKALATSAPKHKGDGKRSSFFFFLTISLLKPSSIKAETVEVKAGIVRSVLSAVLGSLSTLMDGAGLSPEALHISANSSLH